MTKSAASPPSGSPIPGGAAPDPALQAVAALALDLVAEGAVVGLGTGRAAAAFIAALGARVRDGFKVSGVPTSAASEKQARALGIPIVALDEDRELDLTVDGADEVAPNLDVVKGRGGALVRERIVAAASKRQILLVGTDKLVNALGERGPLPVEIIPMARAFVARRLKDLGLRPAVRTADGAADFVTENGNLILDCVLSAPLDSHPAARNLETVLLDIPGVVDTGLFLATAERVLVGHADGHVNVLVRAAEIATGTGGATR